MPLDKTILELNILPDLPIRGTDVSVLVRDGVDYQFAFSQLLTYINGNILAGSTITFAAGIPQNTTGKNTDVSVDPATYKFYQKVNGVWTEKLTIDVTGTGTTIIYGAGNPNPATGSNGDTYVNILTGVFYQKSAGAWTQVFSMASGPAGQQGPAGVNGTNGTNGNTVLSGTTPPAAGVGINGDYYINQNTFIIYGPKAGGAWPAGVSLIPPGGNALKRAYNYGAMGSPVSYDALTMELTLTFNDDMRTLFPLEALLSVRLRQRLSSNSYRQKNDEAIINDNGTGFTTVVFEGIVDPTDLQILIS